MAQDSETPKSIDKGKGKAVDGEVVKGKEVKKDKDGKPLVNGKEDEPAVGGMFKCSQGSLNFLLTVVVASEDLSEEDQQLKSELDMLVERLTVRRCPAMDH